MFKITKKQIIGIITGAVAIVVLFLMGTLFEDANKSKNYVCQMPITGTYHVWTDGGLQWQGMGNVEVYNKTSQVEFSELRKDETGYIAEGKNPAAANRAKVAAGLTPQERVEWEYKTAIGVAEALANSKVRWVPEIMMSGGSGDGDAMDAVSLNMMLEVVKKLEQK